MARLNVMDPKQAEGNTKQMLDKAQQSMGMVPNILKGMANSEVVLAFYMQNKQLFAQGTLSAKEHETIALAVGSVNDCHYCQSAHTVVGKQAGLSEEQTIAIRQGADVAGDEKLSTLSHFARKVMQTKGFVADSDVAAMRSAGYDDGQIAEVVAAIAFNTYTNLFNHVNDTELDFPAAATV